jgi:PleD family two-component response regulator
MLEKILVVSNSELDCETIKSNLTDNFVLLVNNIYEALQHLETYEDIRLVFLDVDLPEMSGYHLLAHLKMTEKYSDIRVIIISKNEEFAKMAYSRDFGKIDFLKKPIIPNRFASSSRCKRKLPNKLISSKNDDTNSLFDLLFMRRRLAFNYQTR